MNFFTFNIDNGYLEGLIRGMKNSLMGNVDYTNLSQSDSLDGRFLYKIIKYL